MQSCFKIALYALIIGILGTPLSHAAIPAINQISPERSTQGSHYQRLPALSAGTDVIWHKAYGPDDLSVNQKTGEVNWDIPSDLPGESFHVGVTAQNADGKDTMVWILTVGNGDVIYVGPGESHTTISAGTAAAESGDTIIIRNGTYVGDANMLINGFGSRGSIPPSGNSSAYTTLMAENPGGVFMDGEGSRRPIFFNGNYPDRSGHEPGTYDCSYIAVKGLVTGNPNTSGPIYLGHVQFVKIIDCGAYDAVSDSAPIKIYRCNYVLIEGCYTWGLGRMSIVFYFTDHSVMRRCVSRMDISNSTEPFGIYDNYLTHDGRIQNCIAIDSDQYNHYTNYGSTAGSFVDACGGSCSYASHKNVINTHCLALNIYGKFISTQSDSDGDSDPYIIRNSVGWNVNAIGNNGTSPTYSSSLIYSRDDTFIEQCTLGNWNSPLDDIGSGTFINGWEGSDSMTNSIIYDFNDYDGSPGGLFYDYETADHNNIFDVGTINVHGTNHTNTIYSDPTQNGLKYITRIEEGSNLSTAGAGGARVGADLTYMFGKSGTMWGEPGFDEQTSQKMWPFPNEDVIREKMKSYSYGSITGNRGFCADGWTLTSYVWNYLGNPSPVWWVNAEEGASSINVYWVGNDLNENISHYMLYYGTSPVDHGGTGADQGDSPINVGNNTQLTLTNLGNQVYYFAVAAVDTDGDEGAKSEPLSAVLQIPIPGDYNDDRNVDISDAILGLQVINGMTKDVCRENTLNGDGKIEMSEILFVLQKMSSIR